MSSATPAPAPPSSSTGNYTSEGYEIIAGLVIEPSGQMVTLWVVMFVFGNLFAYFWLARAFLNAHPHIAYQLDQALAKIPVLGRMSRSHKRSRKASTGIQHVYTDAAHKADAKSTAVSTANTATTGSKSFLTAASSEPTAVTAAAGAATMNGSYNGSVQGIELMPSVGGPPTFAGSPQKHRQHTHHHSQPIICTPSGEIASIQLAGMTAAGDATFRSVSEEGSGGSSSSYSSEDDSKRLPVQLQWINMCFSAKTAEGKKRIIQGIYGIARPRELQGLMGPSGAGKSTLMDLLAMRTDHDGAAACSPGAEDDEDSSTFRGAFAAGATPSRLLVNGAEVSRKDFMAISAYVPQHDNLVPTMTALESVSFYASIVLPADMSTDERKARIARVLRMMGLSHAQHTLVGGTLPGGIMLRGMSGGERKRLAIACGVVSGPSLIFLDEPTSGLDSFAALNVVLFLKSMATEHGATLLASLHQPRQAIWSQMDQVTLLSSGRLMYTGPTEGLVPWFTSLGYAYDPEIHGMASDWALDLVSLGFEKPQHEQQSMVVPEAEAPDGERQEDQGQSSTVRARGSRHSAVTDSIDSMASAYSSSTAAAGSSSMARRQQQQIAALRAGSSMMSSRTELTGAAAAFLHNLQLKHPQWFSANPGLSVVVAPAANLPPLSASAGAARAEALGDAAGGAAAVNLSVRKHSSNNSEESVATQASLFSGPMTVHQGQVLKEPAPREERAHTQLVQLQRVQWWSEAGVHGGPPAPPPGARYGVQAGAQPDGSKWWSDPDSYIEVAQLPTYSQTESPTSPTSEYTVASSAVLLKDKAPSVTPASTAAVNTASVGKPVKQSNLGMQQLTLVEESGPFGEQSVVPAAVRGSSTSVVGAPVGLHGLQDFKERQSLLGRFRSSWQKYRALLWRELLITTRNPADVGGRMMTFTYVSFLSGLVSWSLPGGADSMFQRMSVAYAVLTFYFLMPFVFMSIFTSDKRFFAQDATARLYHPAQYYLSKVTVTLPFNIVVAIVFHLVYYGMTGMRHGAQFVAMACTICVLTGLIGMQAVYCCAIMASSQDLAFVYAIAWTALNLLVNPYMAMFDTYSLGWGFSWLRFFSPCNFAWQALVQIEFSGRGFDCNQGAGTEAVGLFPDLLPSDSSFNLIRNGLQNLGRFSTNNQCVASGDAIVEMYTTGLSFGEIIGILIGYYVLFLTVTYLVVKRSARSKSKI